MAKYNTNNNFLVKFFYVFCITGVLNILNLHAETNELHCNETLRLLENKNIQLKEALVSVESLLESKNKALVSLGHLFKIDLNNETEIVKRIAELDKLSQLDQIVQQSEYDHYKKCLITKEHTEIFNLTASNEISLNIKKISFLKLDKATRDNLISIFESSRQQSVDNELIEKQLSDSEQSLKNAKLTLNQNEGNKAVGGSSSSDKIVSAIMLVENFLVNIETEHIDFIDDIKKIRETLNLLRLDLNSNSKVNVLSNEIEKKFVAIDTIWTRAADSLLKTFSQMNIESQYQIPDFQNDLETNSYTQNEFEKYVELRNKAKIRFTKLTEDKRALIQDLKALNFRLVSDSGHLRSKLINRCHSFDLCDDIGRFNEKTISGIITEIRILPLKFLAGGLNKIVEFKIKMNGGLDAWMDVGRQFFIFIFLVLFPFFTHKFLNLFSLKLAIIRENEMIKSIGNAGGLWGSWINKMNPFIPSLGMVLAVYIARSLIETTDLKEISYLLFYLEIYYFYSIIRLILKSIFEGIFSSESLLIVNDLSLRAGQSAARISRFFFVRYLILHIIEDTVRRSLFYGLAFEILQWISFFIIIHEVRHWQISIIQGFETRFSKLWERIKFVTQTRFKIIVLPVLLCFIIVNEVFKYIVRRLIQFDFFKRIVSEVFRKKIEQKTAITNTSKKPSQDYLNLFDYYLPAKEEFYIDRAPLMAKEILKTIDAWLSGEVIDDFVVLSGNRGIGKTTSAKMIFSSIKTESKIFAWAPPRICTESELLKWLSDVFSTPITSLNSFLEMEKNLNKKIIVVIDDIHNLFISKIGGFSAYRLFMEIIGQSTPKIFWCCTVNSNSWSYLQGVLGKEYFYGRVFEMRMWTDTEIQNLILARHNLTGYSRMFDQAIVSYGPGNMLGEQVETHFFRLLWGQSRGNPRSALMYWVSSISEMSEKELYVGVPKFINSSIVSTMSNNALVILAAIARHDSLTMEELLDVTRINKLTVVKILNESVEKEFLWIDDSRRIRISSKAQNAIDYYLKGKNFLYE